MEHMTAERVRVLHGLRHDYDIGNLAQRRKLDYRDGGRRLVLLPPQGWWVFVREDAWLDVSPEEYDDLPKLIERLEVSYIQQLIAGDGDV